MNKIDKPLRQTSPFVRRHRTFFVGLFVIIPAIALPLFLFYTLMKVEFLHGWCYLHAKYENSYGLTAGNQVSISGMNVGHIIDVSLVREGEIWIEMKIKKEYQHLIRKNTKAQLKQKNFVVGDWNVELTGGTDDMPQVADNDTLISEFPLQIDKTINQITGMVTAIEQSVQLVLSGKGTVGRLLTEDSIVNYLYSVGKNVNGLTGQSKEILGKTDTFMLNLVSASESAKNIIDTIQIVSTKVTSALDSVDKILQNIKLASDEVPPSVKQLRSEIAEAELMMKSVQSSWIYKKMAGKENDPVLKVNP